MPTPETIKELKSLGLSAGEVRPCGRCGQNVEWWGKQAFNLESHPTAPLMLHMFSCNEPLDEEAVGALPPIPIQVSRDLEEAIEIAKEIELEANSIPDGAEIRDADWYKREYERLVRERA